MSPKGLVKADTLKIQEYYWYEPHHVTIKGSPSQVIDLNPSSLMLNLQRYRK